MHLVWPGLFCWLHIAQLLLHSSLKVASLRRALLALQSCAPQGHCVLSSVVCGAGLLPRLLQAQQLDKHDIEAIHPLYMHICQQLEDQVVTAPSRQHQAALHHKSGPANQGAARMRNAHPHVQQLLDRSHSEQIKLLREYLLAATAKDCSIMITIQLLPSDCYESVLRSVAVPGCQHKAKYKVAVVDLDVKSCCKIPGHLLLHCQLTSC